MFNGSILRGAIGAMAVFIATVITGAIIASRTPGFGNTLMQALKDEVFSQILDENPVVVMFNIFLNNLEACILLFIGGAVFGVLTLIILSMNGFLIGAIAELFRSENGALYVIAALLPHGIFEIAAFILASTLGLLLGEAIWHEMHGSGDAALRASELGRIFICYVVPLLAVAAIVEAFITPQILILLL
jgi:stage II sporulation protein M